MVSMRTKPLQREKASGMRIQPLQKGGAGGRGAAWVTVFRMAGARRWRRRIELPTLHSVKGVYNDGVCVGLARTIYIRFIYGIFGRESTKYTAIYGVYIRFWPTLCMRD